MGFGRTRITIPSQRFTRLLEERRFAHPAGNLEMTYNACDLPRRSSRRWPVGRYDQFSRPVIDEARYHGPGTGAIIVGKGLGLRSDCNPFLRRIVLEDSTLQIHSVRYHIRT